ncbi:MAG: 2Fe-2S iron-sulfur cluster-binding protein [Thermoleophilia bacterium]|nr:2Fe-2S iron-sulfur cluster-binding protein [Thermoleophilia bacterium]MDH4339475.1 2Fe-2S iron-sulfur cluster-binding protein [Thermoleophilia bacterium]
MRLEPRSGERIDRSKPVSFSFAGWKVAGFEGDTLGSAAFAAGKRVFSRSFKYHRPRGLLCCSGHCPNCLMTVDGVPNVRVCTEPIREGAVVEGQNVRWSLDFDFMSVTDKVGGPFTPVGFYYRTFIRPRRLWPFYEKFLRSAAGLGELDEHAGYSRRYDTEHRKARVLVVGGGPAGRAAALAAAASGDGVVLVDEDASLNGMQLDGVEVLAPARALGIWEGGLVPVDAGTVLYRFRAARIIVATGAIEQPLVFPGNDLIGVMLPGGVRRLVNDFSIKPGNRAIVVAADDEGFEVADDLSEAGVAVPRVIDLRETRPRELVAQGGKGRVRRLVVDGESFDCDLLVASGGRQPAYSLLAQAGARIEFDSELGVFVPTELPSGVEAVGSVTGDGLGKVDPEPAYGGKGKCFVCVCEDVTTKDMKRAIAEGFDSIELAKRYTTTTMGPCQGKLCHLPSIRLYSKETRVYEAAIGTTTARPPWAPVELGLLAGRELTPARRTSMHWSHAEAGATIQWAGPWKRPYAYGEKPEDEVRAVHESLGVIDVSTLGKLFVEGPEAVALLERLYPNRFGDMKSGRIRYGVLTSDAGRIMDDGTIARLADDLYYVTTTSTGADAVTAWFEWWNAVWGYEAEIVNVTGAIAAVNLAGPQSRDALQRLTEADVSAEAFKYLDAQEIDVAGVPTLALRIGFVGELGYELHFPSPAGEYLWGQLVAEGARPFGLEPQRILRLEKGHVIVGQDTDSESNLYSAGMSWLPKLDKDDFVGKYALEHFAEREEKERLVGFTMEEDVLPAEGAQIVVEGFPAGRVTSARRSEAVGSVIGLAWVPTDRAKNGTRVEIRVDRLLRGARVTHGAFFDSAGQRMRS